MERRRSATFANPDSIERPVQRIEGIEQRFGLGFATFAPEALGHFVQRLDRAFDLCGGCGFFMGWFLLRHSRIVSPGNSEVSFLTRTGARIRENDEGEKTGKGHNALDALKRVVTTIAY
jgi:hypothetical protein